VGFAAVTAAIASASPARAGEQAAFPAIERAIEIARNNALAVADAKGELQSARAQLTGAKASAIGNPYIDFQVEQGLSGGLAAQALGYAYIPVDVSGQRGARIREAEQLIKWRDMGVGDARASVTGEAVAAYADVLLSTARVEHARAGEVLARDEAGYAAVRLGAKDTTVYEQSLSEAEVARWLQTSAEANLRLTSARSRLAQLLGVSDVGIPEGASQHALVPLRGTWDEAAIQRVVECAPSLVRLAAEGAFWESSGERFKKERNPPVSFELIGGRGELGEARVGGGAVLTFPITRRYQGEIARSEAEQLRVAQRMRAVRTILENRLRAARDAVRLVTTTVAELDASGMPALEKAVAAAEQAHKLGKVELARVLMVRRDLATARSRRLDLLESGWRALAEMTAISGDLP